MSKENILEQVKKVEQYLREIKNLEADSIEMLMLSTENLCREIRFHLNLENVKAIKINDWKPIEEKSFTAKAGQLVRIKPCDKQYENQTFLGVIVGAVPTSIRAQITQEEIELDVGSYNPAIYVFKLKKTILGNASWWSEIDVNDELKDITDEEINNTWYVKLLRNWDA